jgi:putative ABC transport system ATP-binding protein
MGNTIVMITHDLGVAQFAKRIVRIVDGQLQE